MTAVETGRDTAAGTASVVVGARLAAAGTGRDVMSAMARVVAVPSTRHAYARPNFAMKHRDTSTSLRCELPAGTDPEGASVAFSTATMKGAMAIIQRAPAHLVSTLPPRIQCDWQEGDTAASGIFNAGFELIWPDGGTFPAANCIHVTVNGDLG